ALFADVAPGTSPALIFAFCPNGEPFSGDKYANTLSALAGNAPVIGGVCSDDYDYERARVFLSGAEYKDSIVLICLWGEVRPTFSIRHVTSRFAERIRRVVNAKDNVVYQVGDETFVEYLEGFGLRTDVPDPLVAFTSYPMMLTREGEDETPLMRHIAALDLESGAGTFIADVPTGALANICLINRDDIKVSARESMDALLEKMKEQPDYEYSTVFCISCCGRAVILGSDSDAEGSILVETLPANMALAGSYCLGELCPTRYVDGVATNRFHNCSITFCAL
ncbi:MAG: FIST C-terminal domain-containing protein, partial [Coriobacteriales bacterium]|nr:FIST C-terminal domain-containing protein [Coriobacteriales bacterium]